MRQLSSDVREFIDLLNTKNVRYVIEGMFSCWKRRNPRANKCLADSIAPCLKQLLSLLQILRLKPFGKPIVDVG